MKRKPARRGRMDPEFREAVLARDRGCVAHRHGFALDVRCSGRLHVHHRTLGTKVDELWNVLTLCQEHHRYAHDVDRAGAEACGLIIRRGGTVC